MFMWHGSISEKGLKFLKSKCSRLECIGNGDGVEYEVYIGNWPKENLPFISLILEEQQKYLVFFQ